MEYLAGSLVSSLLCFGIGWYAIALVVAGVLSLTSLLTQKISLGKVAYSGFVTALFSIASASNDTIAEVVLLGSLYLGKVSFNRSATTALRAIFLPALFCSILFATTGRTFFLQLTLPVLFSSLPGFKFMPASMKLTLPAQLVLWLLPLLAFIPVVYGPFSQGGSIAYIESGKWANTEKPYTLEGLDIAESYSYSEFLKLIGGRVEKVGKLSSDVSIAWLITPTKPFSEEEESHLQQWVRKGGHLIAVSDHTDLFGHARTLNGLLKNFSSDVTYTATMTKESRDPITYNSGETFSLLTGNTVEGKSIWPIASDLTSVQEAYYGRPNFFGPMTPVGNEAFSRWIVLGSKSVGKGTVTFSTDSTIFSNFAVFQPATEKFIRKAQGIELMSRVLPWLPWILLASIVFTLLFTKPVCLPVCLLGLLSLAVIPSPPLKWGGNDTTWSGDPSLVLTAANTEGSFTTAYSIAALSGSRPHWKSQLKPNDRGIWVSRSRPPNEHWKWLSPERNPEAEIIPHDKAWDGLLKVLGGVPILGWQTVTNSQVAKAGSIWTDDRMGTWWFDRGLSPSRKLRFKSFLNWLVDKPIPSNPTPYTPSVLGGSDWVFRMANGDGDKLIKAPKLPDTNTVYLLGDGISAQMVKIEGKDTLISVSPWMEYWATPSIWTATEK